MASLSDAAVGDLMQACLAAHEWAAGYPLQGLCSNADLKASATVYRLTADALHRAEEELKQ